MKPELLLEGPIGHMAHPYENISLSFSKLKEMFKLIVDGFPNIEVTEKLDGQNIIITYDHNTGKARIIRRMKEHTLLGGIDKETTRKFFTTDKVEKAKQIALNKGKTPEEAEELSKDAGIQHVADAFYDAMREFESAAKHMPSEFFKTEDGCQIFYNGEVIDPRSRNIVDYDTQDLVLHRTKHSKLCPGEGKLQSMDDEESQLYSRFLEKHLGMVTAEEEMEELPKVKINALRDFDNIVVDEEILHKAFHSLDNLLATSGLSDSSTIKDYLKKVLDETIESKLDGVNGPIADRVSNAVLFFLTTKKTPRIKTEVQPILDLISDERTKEIVKEFLRTPAALSEIVREAVRPIEYIVHNFAADYLKGVKSLYILNDEEALGGLRKKVGHQVTKIQSLQGQKDIHVLRRNIRKMISHAGDVSAEEALYDENLLGIYDRIASNVEGLVFSYQGQEYKITGQFAPINQIMGLGRFDRGPGKRDLNELPSPATFENLIRESIEDVTSEKIAIFSGGFKPPHVGHFLASKYLANESQATKLYILVGSGVRQSKDGSVTVGPEESSHLWERYYAGAPDVGFEVAIIKISGSPVKWVYEKMESGEFDSDQIFCGIGACTENECEPEDKRWKSLVSSYQNAHQVIVPLQGGSIRGSIMRELLATGDDRFLKFLPDHLSDEEKLSIRNSIVKKDYLK